MNWKERKIWIGRIWAHHHKSQLFNNLVRTSFFDCILGTIVVTLGKCEADRDDTSEYAEIAWYSLPSYFTDFGDGKAWEALGIKGFRFCVWEDSNL